MSAAGAPARRRAGPRDGEPAERLATSGKGRSAGPNPRDDRRYAVVYDVEGPRIRLGVVWFAAAVTALVLGPLATALVYGMVATIGAAQTARSWRRRGVRASEQCAALAAALVALGAVLGAGGVGLGILAAVVVATAGAAAERGSRSAVVADAGITLQTSVPIGLAAASMVLLLRLDVGSAFGLLLLVSAYEIGDYLVGSGASNRFEGPIAGIAAMAVATFIVAGFPITSMEVTEAVALGGATMLAAPAGQLLASVVLPTSRVHASGLRRLDSLLIAAPMWVWSVGLLV